MPSAEPLVDACCHVWIRLAADPRPPRVVGRAVMAGVIGEAELRALVDSEIGDGHIEACR